MDMFHYAMHRLLFEDFAAEYTLEVRLEAALWFNANRNRVKKLSLRGMASALNRIHKAGDEACQAEGTEAVAAPQAGARSSRLHRRGDRQGDLQAAEAAAAAE